MVLWKIIVYCCCVNHYCLNLNTKFKLCINPSLETIFLRKNMSCIRKMPNTLSEHISLESFCLLIVPLMCVWSKATFTSLCSVHKSIRKIGCMILRSINRMTNLVNFLFLHYPSELQSFVSIRETNSHNSVCFSGISMFIFLLYNYKFNIV